MRRNFAWLAVVLVAACTSSSGDGTPSVATPVISPGSGSYATAQSVSITCATPGSSIFYTADGSSPTASSTPYAGPIQVAVTTTVKAIATAPGHAASPIATATFTITSADFMAFCTSIEADLTALMVSCLKANPEWAALQKSIGCDGLLVDLQAGRLVYDAAHGAGCRAAVTARGCATFADNGGGEPAECRLALVPQVPVGSVCYGQVVCQDVDSTCGPVANGGCPGRCVPFAQLGDGCGPVDCAPGLACDGSPPTCKALAAAGGACPCQAGLYCDISNRCAPQQTTGACSSGSQCAVGYACTGSISTCQPMVGAGATCTSSGGSPNVSQCGPGYRCAAGTCVAGPYLGDACLPSEACIGSICDGITCVADLSGGSCSAAPGLAGVSLYDGFTAPAIDGTRWQNGAQTRGVSGGAAFLGVEVVNERPRSIRNDTYASQISVVGGGQRVTSLQADVTVPAATAARSGGTMIRAAVRQLYSPPSQRLNFPGANKDLLVAEVGLIDDGGGLKAYRQFTHCDDASCATYTTSGIAVTDPAGFSPIGTGQQVGAPAAYDTRYTLKVSLDEATGVFHWSVAGGTFGTPGVSGTADPSAYLAGAAGWSGVPLAGSGFQLAQLAARTNDHGTGGGAGKITGRFDDVWVGFNNAAATPFDDFSGSGGNSGPAELSADRWTPGGASTLGPSGGSLLIHHQLTAPGATNVSAGGAISWSLPAGVNTLLADVGIESYASGAPGGFFAGLNGRFYNDGSGTRDHDATGDIVVNFGIQANSATAFFFIGRCTNAACGTTTLVGSATLAGVTLDASHRLSLQWSETARRFTFGVDGATVTVDPTTLGGVVTAPAAFGGPARAPTRTLLTNVAVGASSPGLSTVGTARFSDVFSGP